jgi:hypothetical protein
MSPEIIIGIAAGVRAIRQVLLGESLMSVIDSALGSVEDFFFGKLSEEDKPKVDEKAEEFAAILTKKDSEVA